MVLNGKKYCPKCKKWIVIGSFHKDKQNKDGLATICRYCRKVYKKGTVK